MIGIIKVTLQNDTMPEYSRSALDRGRGQDRLGGDSWSPLLQPLSSCSTYGQCQSKRLSPMRGIGWPKGQGHPGYITINIMPTDWLCNNMNTWKILIHQGEQ